MTQCLKKKLSKAAERPHAKCNVLHQKRAHVASAHLCQSNSGPDLQSWSWFQLRITTPEPDDFQNVIRTFLSKDISPIKFTRRTGQFFRRCEPHWGKMPDMAMLRNSSKKNSLMWICNVDDFNQFFVVHRHICGEISWRSDQLFHRHEPNLPKC